MIFNYRAFSVKLSTVYRKELLVRWHTLCDKILSAFLIFIFTILCVGGDLRNLIGNMRAFNFKYSQAEPPFTTQNVYIQFSRKVAKAVSVKTGFFCPCTDPQYSRGMNAWFLSPCLSYEGWFDLACWPTAPFEVARVNLIGIFSMFNVLKKSNISPMHCTEINSWNKDSLGSSGGISQ